MNKITIEELSELFPDGIPMIAMKLLFPERSAALTLDEIRILLCLLSRHDVKKEEGHEPQATEIQE